MPLYVLSNEHNFDEIIRERRLNLFVFTVCWSYGSKLCLCHLFDLSNDPQFSQLKFYRINLHENNQNFADRLNIIDVPTVRWYCQGVQLDELVGADLSQLVTKTHQCIKICKRKMEKAISKRMSISAGADENKSLT